MTCELSLVINTNRWAGDSKSVRGGKTPAEQARMRRGSESREGQSTCVHQKKWNGQRQDQHVWVAGAAALGVVRGFC